MLQEKDLIEAAQRGDVEAFEVLIRQYEKEIYRFCLKILQDEQEAADTFQEICLKIWRQLKSYKGEANLKTWIYRLTTNQCIDVLRKNKRKKQLISLFQRNEKGEEYILDSVSSEDVSQKIETKALQEIVQLGISELKADYQVIIILKDMEAYSYEEIAEILGISLGTVKSRLSRARKALRNVLEQKKEPYQSFFV